MMSVPLKIVMDKAEEYDKVLRADDPRFDHLTIVQHEDGSHFLFMNAFACSYSFVWDKYGLQKYIVVFTEHHGTHAYSEDEVVVTVLGNNRGHQPINPLE